MDWVLVLLTVCLDLAVGRVACPIVQCSTSLPSGECFSRDPKSYDVSIQLCPQNQTCEFNQMLSSESYNFTKSEQYCHPSDWLPSKKFPGETCVQPMDCLSGICDKVCRGVSAGAVCKDFGDCASGLVCKDKVCVEQVPLGGMCTKNYDCANDCLCYQRVCSSYFSLQNEAIGVTDNYLCQSGYAEKGVCKAAPANKNPPDSPCYDNSDCSLTNGEDGLCLCGMNSQGVPFCASRQGDIEFSNLKSAMLSMLAESRSCHFNTSLTLRCPSHFSNRNFTTFLNALYIYYYRPSIVGVSSCVLNMMPFAADFPYATADLGSSGGNSSTVVIIVTVCVFSVLLLVGVVCFFCVRKYAQQDTFEHQLQRRIMNNEYGIVEVFIGLPPEQQPVPREDRGRFTMEDVVLNEKNRRFLKVGIPVAIEVHEETHELIGEPELAPLAECQSVKSPLRPGSVSETTPTSALLPSSVQ